MSQADSSAARNGKNTNCTAGKIIGAVNMVELNKEEALIKTLPC